MEDKKIIEINGVKLEVDLRHAKTVDTYCIGDAVKVLIKGYGDSYTSYPGIIAGFDDFQSLPTIVIAYLDVSYGSAEIKLVHLNMNTKDTEICPKSVLEVALDKQTAIDHFEREIVKKQLEADELKARLKYFLDNFGKHFKTENKASTQRV